MVSLSSVFSSRLSYRRWKRHVAESGGTLIVSPTDAIGHICSGASGAGEEKDPDKRLAPSLIGQLSAAETGAAPRLRLGGWWMEVIQVRGNNMESFIEIGPILTTTWDLCIDVEWTMYTYIAETFLLKSIHAGS